MIFLEPQWSADNLKESGRHSAFLVCFALLICLFVFLFWFVFLFFRLFGFLNFLLNFVPCLIVISKKYFDFFFSVLNLGVCGFHLTHLKVVKYF